MADYCFIYSVFPSHETAASVARELLEKQLIACAHISASGESFYHWEGKLEQSAEVVMLAKTTRLQNDLATAHIAKCHPYTLPCILTLPIESGWPPYLNWLKQEIASPKNNTINT